jgi:hypothetical protein
MIGRLLEDSIQLAEPGLARVHGKGGAMTPAVPALVVQTLPGPTYNRTPASSGAATSSIRLRLSRGAPAGRQIAGCSGRS